MEELTKRLNEICPFRYMWTSESTKLPYGIITDYSEEYTKADNKIDNTIVRVQIDYFTNVAYDVHKQAIKRVLDDMQIPFSYTQMYEADERVYHHIFDCEVV